MALWVAQVGWGGAANAFGELRAGSLELPWRRASALGVKGWCSPC